MQQDYAQKLINGELPILAEVKTSLLHRFELTNRIFKTYLTNKKTFSKSLDELESIFEDKDLFMKNNRDIITILYPGFINKLSESSLTEEEINYCCLYIIGLSGKEISLYMESSSHYNLSSSIRKKLALGPQDTNLSIYLKGILNDRVDLKLESEG